MKRDMREASFQEMLRWVSFSNMQVKQAKLAKLRNYCGLLFLTAAGRKRIMSPYKKSKGALIAVQSERSFFEVNAYERHDTAGKGE